MSYLLSEDRGSVKPPFINKARLEAMAEYQLKQFKPELLESPLEVDVDDFAFGYLGLKQDYRYLSSKGVYLGMMIFKEGYIPIYVPEENRAEWAFVEEDTIIIDESLCEEHMDHRYRYTLGHEIGHSILHRCYYRELLKNSGEYMVYEDTAQCKDKVNEDNLSKKWSVKETLEWQANYFASALLMPRTTVHKFISSLSKREDDFRETEYVFGVMETFNVSFEAALNRLCALGIIRDRKGVISKKSIYLDFVLGT